VNPKPDLGVLRFRHPILAVGLLVLLAILVGGLGWWNARRGGQEVAALRAALCGALPQEVLAALDELARGVDPESDTDQRALALLDGHVKQKGDTTHEVRILQQTAQGWREWRSWRGHADWAYQPPLLDGLGSGDCASSLEEGRVRVVRRVRSADGALFVLVAERQRE